MLAAVFAFIQLKKAVISATSFRSKYRQRSEGHTDETGYFISQNKRGRKKKKKTKTWGESDETPGNERIRNKCLQ